MPRVYMPQRLSSDVDQAEQAEQQRLEDGWDDPTPSPGENVRSEEASPGGSGPASGGAVQSERVVLPESVGIVVTTHLALKGSLCLQGPQKMTVMRESLALTLSFPCLPHIQSR